MTPKEKAQELAMRFDRDGETDNAIACALICVDEILEALWRVKSVICDWQITYYVEVKQELEQN
jgi:hypothetical protein